MTNIDETFNAIDAAFEVGDPRLTFAKAVAVGRLAIAGVRPEQFTAPTPCDEMDVRGLLGHLVMVLRRVSAAGRGDDPRTWPSEVTGVADDGWEAAWLEAAHGVQAAWTDPGRLDASIRLPWTTMSGADLLRTYTNEVVVHTWDLATATGQAVAWPDDVLEVAFAAIQQALPAVDREASYAEAKAGLPPGVPWVPPFAAAVDVPADAPLIDRLVAWNGRRP